MSHVRPWRIATVALVATASLLLSRSSLLETLTDGMDEEQRPVPVRTQRVHTPTIVESSADWMEGRNSPSPDPTSEAHQVQAHALLYLLQPNPAGEVTDVPSTADSGTNAGEDTGRRFQR